MVSALTAVLAFFGTAENTPLRFVTQIIFWVVVVAIVLGAVWAVRWAWHRRHQG